MERRAGCIAVKNSFGRRRKKREDEGSPKISSHETMVAFPSEVLKNLSLRSVLE